MTYLELLRQFTPDEINEVIDGLNADEKLHELKDQINMQAEIVKVGGNPVCPVNINDDEGEGLKNS